MTIFARLSSALQWVTNVRNARTVLAIGGALFTLSLGLVTSHVLAIRDMRDTGFPIAAEVETLQRRKVTIAEQNEIVGLQASARGDTYRELYDLYVLPARPDVPRALGTVETLLTMLARRGVVREIQSMTTDDATISVTVTVASGESDTLLDLLDLGGVLTVSDTFLESERQMLLALTERENPTVIAALEQFLSGDLLQYAQAPERIEGEFLKSVESRGFEQDFRSIIGSSRLGEFAETAKLLSADRTSLWPLPLMTVESSAWEDMGTSERLTLTLKVHGKDN